MRMLLLLLVLLLAEHTLNSSAATAQRLAFAPLLASGGVLQRGEPAAVWGVGAAPGAAVVVTLHAQPRPVTVDAVADAAGNWSLALPAQPAQWRVRLSALSDGATAATTVSFGTVLLCAGASHSTRQPSPAFTPRGLS